MNDNVDDRLLPDAEVCQRYGVTPMTLWRWDHDPTLSFPPAVRIRSRKYRRLSTLVQWERSREAA